VTRHHKVVNAVGNRAVANSVLCDADIEHLAGLRNDRVNDDFSSQCRIARKLPLVAELKARRSTLDFSCKQGQIDLSMNAWRPEWVGFSHKRWRYIFWLADRWHADSEHAALRCVGGCWRRRRMVTGAREKERAHAGYRKRNALEANSKWRAWRRLVENTLQTCSWPSALHHADRRWISVGYASHAACNLQQIAGIT